MSYEIFEWKLQEGVGAAYYKMHDNAILMQLKIVELAQM